MKKFLKTGGIVVGVLAILGSGIVALVFYLTADLPKAADEFFSLVKQGKTKAAYDSTAQGFRASTTFEDFTKFLGEYSLNGVKSTSWGNRSISFTSGTGKLEGSVTLAGEKRFFRISTKSRSLMTAVFSSSSVPFHHKSQPSISSSITSTNIPSGNSSELT